MITLKDIKENPEVDALIRGAQKQLNALGYTEHGHRHISIVSKRAGDILEKLGTNGVHPTMAGYLQIGDVFYRALVADLKKQSENNEK